MNSDPGNDFIINTSYYVNISSAAFEDALGNDFSGISNTNSWNFTTVVEVTAPTILGLSPSDGATGVPIYTNLVLTFSEVVHRGSGNITIKKSSDNSIVETISIIL